MNSNFWQKAVDYYFLVSASKNDWKSRLFDIRAALVVENVKKTIQTVLNIIAPNDRVIWNTIQGSASRE